MRLPRHDRGDGPTLINSPLVWRRQNSKSPNGKFGFHVTTYSGNLPQMNEWEDRWEMYFAKSIRLALDLEIKVKAYDPELDILVPTLFDKVIPRLLKPLESEGRSVKPSLVHGDLWYDNSGVDLLTDESLIFDACCFYAHNVYEFGQLRPVCNRFGAEYLAAYHSYVQISAPKENYDKLRFNSHVAALFTENETLREQQYDPVYFPTNTIIGRLLYRMLGDMRDVAKRYG